MAPSVFRLGAACGLCKRGSKPRRGGTRPRHKHSRLWARFPRLAAGQEWPAEGPGGRQRGCTETVGCGPHSPADVLRSQLLPARLALKTAQMPVFVQSQQGLAMFDFCAAARTTWKTQKCATSGGSELPFHSHHPMALPWPSGSVRDTGHSVPLPVFLLQVSAQALAGPPRRPLDSSPGWLVLPILWFLL